MKLKNETLRAFYARTNTQDRKVLHYRDLDRVAAVRRYARKGEAL